jgi:hypothetical protein
MRCLNTPAIALTVKDAIPMSKSNQKPASRKAGIALSADARKKLHQLADWIEEEIRDNQDPYVRLDYIGVITVRERSDATHLSPLGAFVQMFQPFSAIDLKALLDDFHIVPCNYVYFRAATILDISINQLYVVQRQMFQYGYHFSAVVRGLRSFK